MALTRGQSATIIAAENAELFTLLGVGTGDTSGALKEPIDAALRVLGVAESALATATVSDDDRPGFLAVLTYRTLLRLRRAAATRKQSISGNGVSITYGNTVAAIDALIVDALAEMGLYGRGQTMASGAFGLDFVEPEEVAV